MKHARLRNSILSLVALSGSLFLSGLAVEILLRLFGHDGAAHSDISMIYRVDDHILNWRRVPNVEMKEGNIVYRFNNLGFRDVDHLVEKPSGIERIVVLGDSVTEGYGVEWTSMFSSNIQSRLGSTFEVISIAAPGLNTPQEVHLFEQEGLRYRPDLVVLNFVLNDCDFYSNFEGGQRYEREKNSKIGLFNLPINPRLKSWLKSSALIYFIKERVENLKGKILGEDDTDYFTRIWSRDENRRKVTKALDRLAALRKENEFEVVVIIWPLIAEYRDYQFVSIHEWLEEKAKERAFSTIDLLPRFSEVSYRELQVSAEDNIHPNAFGHRMAAEAFVTWYGWRERRAFGVGGKGGRSAKDEGVSIHLHHLRLR